MMTSFRWSTALVALGLIVGVGSAQAQCVGDCDNNGEVTVDEIVTMVNAALTGGDGGCPSGDADDNGEITVDEIITAVDNALKGCPAPMTPTPGGDPVCGNGTTETGEECDNGGFCAGGESSGTACNGDADCAGNLGACIGGANNLRGCELGDEAACPDGTCVKCRPVGGDGCAQNCTNETDIAYPLKPGVINGVVIQDGSGATVYGPFLTVPLAFSGGSVNMKAGKSRNGGPIPVSIPATSVTLPRIPVQSIACACVRGVTAQTCGGTVYDERGNLSPNCTPGFENQQTCPVDRPCAPVHGPGNTGSGLVNCGGDGKEYGVDYSQDCNGAQGEPPFDAVSTISETGSGAGSAYVILSGAVGTVVGSCTGTSADYGADGQFCTADDAPSTFGSPNPIPLTTGSATGTIYNPADFDGDVNGPWTTSGARFTCNGGNLTTSAGANLAGVFTSCDQPTINDIVVPNNFESNQ